MVDSAIESFVPPMSEKVEIYWSVGSRMRIPFIEWESFQEILTLLCSLFSFRCRHTGILTRVRIY